MADRTLGPKGSKRRRRLLLFVPLTLVAALVLAIGAAAGPVSVAAGFEGDDGNLAPAAPINFDWNSFAPTTWTGTAPLRTAIDSANGWEFTGIEDRQAVTSDSAFAGGTKQDDACATVGSGKSPNKDDLKRYYLANSTAANGDIFLALAWVRIPQNTTSSSAHVGFEFNQSETACGAASDGLVERTEGDLLFVYDFEGGSADPRITLREWVTSGACEVGSNSPPCWGPASDLTASGFAEAEVNVGTSVLDQVADPDETLNDSEFGETIINLSDAGVFTPGECVAFGKTFAVSRSSGNSAQAQMKDLVGPADINIQNCGSIIIHKQTVPSPDPTGTSFGYTTTGGLIPPTFSLLDTEREDFQSPEILAGPYSVTEGDPGPNFVLTAINCTSSGTSTFTTDVGTRTVNIDLDATDTVECTFVNTLQTGAIKITKTRKHAATPGNEAHAGVQFTIGGTAVTTDANGQACVDGLAFGSYDVVETVPAGYVGEGGSTTTVTKSVTVDNTATCAGSPYVGESVSFHNTPLTNITVSVDSQVDGGTASTIDCGAGVVSTGPNGDGSTSRNNLVPGTYTCTIVIDP
jgi:Prealbumin-like fold domain